MRVKKVEKYFWAKSNSPEGFYTKACDVMKEVCALATVIKGWGGVAVALNTQQEESNGHEE